jgi:pimeloyl-ACP methyl ester carboxylesterase
MRAKLSEPAVIFGHSMGGWVAASVAARAPEAVRAIILVDTALYTKPVPDDATLTNLFGADAAALREGGTSLRSWPQSLRDLDPEVITTYIEGRLVGDFDVSLYESVQCPVLLLQGDPAEGGLMSENDVTLALQHFKHARHVKIERTGHWVHVQEGERVVKEMEAFLNGLGSVHG